MRILPPRAQLLPKMARRAVRRKHPSRQKWPIQGCPVPLRANLAQWPPIGHNQQEFEIALSIGATFHCHVVIAVHFHFIDQRSKQVVKTGLKTIAPSRTRLCYRRGNV